MPSHQLRRLSWAAAVLAIAVVVVLVFWRAFPRTNGAAAQVPVSNVPEPEATLGRPMDEASAAVKLPLLEEPFHDTWSAAEQGDAVAQLRLSRVLALCTPYNFVTRTGVSGNLQILWEAIKRDAPGELERMKAISDREARYCLQVLNGRPIPPDEVLRWRRMSADQGNVVAQLEQEALSVSSAMSSTEREALVKRAVESRDPEAVFFVGRLAGNPGASVEDPTLSALLAGAHGSLAWQVVACRMGYACSRSSRLMIDACLYAGLCGYGSFEELARALVPRADHRAFDDRVVRISQYVNHPQ